MSVSPFLAELDRLNIRLRLDGDQLRLSAPRGALSPQLRERLQKSKPDIVEFLRVAQAAASAQQRFIVPLQPRGTRTPVFGIAGHTGEVFAYRALAQALGEDQPFFGLQPPGLDGRSTPLTRVEDLAACFAEQIWAFRPNGPWILAGYCMGGTVAFELAQQLIARGGTVPFVAFFGAPFPRYYASPSASQHRAAWQVHDRLSRLRLRAHSFAAQTGRQRLEYVVGRLKQFTQPKDPLTRMKAELGRASLVALRAYAPRPFGGRVLHFLPSPTWAQRSRSQAELWRTVAPRLETWCGPQECIQDEMLLPRWAPVFAEQFNRCAQAPG